jgi:hypothetical protein
MSKKKHRGKGAGQPPSGMPMPKQVPSLLDIMEDGNEYGSIVPYVQPGDLVVELRRALSEIEQIRGRPCLCYAANLVRPVPDTSIQASDHLPFAEMVGRVPASEKKVDVLLATPGGSGEQVTLFVEALRPRFDEVDFLIPYKAMSAGTLWAFSGDRIWMDAERAFLGPIDPQVPASDGQFVPAQALLALLARIQQEGAEALQKGQQPPWTHLQLLKHMDQRQLGAAMSASQYVVDIAAQYLERYKFRGWTTHRTTNPGTPVTPQDRKERAVAVADQLCSHERWRAHGHAISRDVLWKELHVEIDQPEKVPGLQRAMRRMWALLYYTFDRGIVAKLLFSNAYVMVRGVNPTPAPGRRAP